MEARRIVPAPAAGPRGTLDAMSLTPDLVADVLVRQGLITPAQGDQVKKEARLLPTPDALGPRLRAARGGLRAGRAPALPEPRRTAAVDRRAGDRARHRRRRRARPRAHRHPQPVRRPHRVEDLAAVRQAPPHDPAGDGRTAGCRWPAPTPSTSRASTPSAASPAARSSWWSPPSPTSCKAINEFYGLRHSVKRAERDLTKGIDLGNLEQLVRMKSETEIES